MFAIASAVRAYDADAQWAGSAYDLESKPDGQGGWQEDPARTVRYIYYVNGHVSNITIKDEYPGVGDPADYEWYYDLALYYSAAGQLWRVLWDKWKLDGGQSSEHTLIAAREFYYDGLGQRFVARDVDPSTWEPIEPRHWTDTMGLLPYGDFDVTVTEDPPGEFTADVHELVRYLPGFGLHAQQTVDGDTDPVRYLHGDLIDSTMLTTDEQGAADGALAYTAFGEPVGDPAGLATRYQYAGSWAYESGLLSLAGANPELAAITLQHLGWRWYQPHIGRFIMRDPIGLMGSLNLYVYCDNNPLIHVDPSGLLSLWAGGGPLGWDPMSGGIIAGDYPPHRWAWDLAKAMWWRLVGVARNIAVPGTRTPAPTVPVTTCLTIVRGLDALGQGLGPILHYVRARNAAIRGDWDAYERYARRARQLVCY